MENKKHTRKYVIVDEEIKVGDDIIAFGVTDKCLKIDNHIPNEPNYYGKKIKWTVGKHCSKIIREKEKTVEDINNWFVSEVDDALSNIPEPMRNMAKIDKQAMKIVAESIATKKGFQAKAVLKHLKTVLK